MNKKKIIVVLVIIVVVFAILFSVQLFYKKKRDKIAQERVASLLERTRASLKHEGSLSDKSSWVTYRNDQYGFEFKHPPSYHVAQARQEGASQGNSIVVANTDQDVSHSSFVWIYLPVETYESSANPTATSLDDYSGEYQGLRLYTIVHEEERRVINNAETLEQVYSSGRWEEGPAGGKTFSVHTEDEQDHWLRFVFYRGNGEFIILKSFLYNEQDRRLLEEIAATFKFIN